MRVVTIFHSHIFEAKTLSPEKSEQILTISKFSIFIKLKLGRYIFLKNLVWVFSHFYSLYQMVWWKQCRSYFRNTLTENQPKEGIKNASILEKQDNSGEITRTYTNHEVTIATIMGNYRNGVDKNYGGNSESNYRENIQPFSVKYLKTFDQLSHTAHQLSRNNTVNWRILNQQATKEEKSRR